MSRIATPQSGGASLQPWPHRVEPFLSGLEVPWSIVFMPDGGMLIAERPGRVRVVENGRLLPQPAHVVPDVVHDSEIGLMGLTLHPAFEHNRLVYLAYGHGAGEPRVRVVRLRFEHGTLVEPHTILDGIPAAANHAGCRLRFGPDGKLYVTTGDATDRRIAQDLGSLGGKILRLNDDGSAPSDNPFAGRGGARAEIWSLGHRNGQGLDWQPGSGALFESEHGPSGFDGPGGGDEINHIVRGGDYGWPAIHHRMTREGMHAPILELTPAVAPASASFYPGRPGSTLAGNLLVGCLRGEGILRIALDGTRVAGHEMLIHERYGRIRDVVPGPDGAVYVSTSNRDGRGEPAAEDDRILRLVPLD